MAIHTIKNLSSACKIGLWKISETVEELVELLPNTPHRKAVMEKIKTFANPKRRCEWLATRLLANELTQHDVVISYDEDGKPFIENLPINISISHSQSFVAVIVSEKPTVGIDIEQISEKIARIALKFLHIDEMETLEEKNRIKHMYLHWCAKETLYKAYGQNNLSFIENIRIFPFSVESQGVFDGCIALQSETRKYKLEYTTLDDFVMVWTVCD